MSVRKDKKLSNKIIVSGVTIKLTPDWLSCAAYAPEHRGKGANPTDIARMHEVLADSAKLVGSYLEMRGDAAVANMRSWPGFANAGYGDINGDYAIVTMVDSSIAAAFKFLGRTIQIERELHQFWTARQRTIDSNARNRTSIPVPELPEHLKPYV